MATERSNTRLEMRGKQKAFGWLNPTQQTFKHTFLVIMIFHTQQTTLSIMFLVLPGTLFSS